MLFIASQASSTPISLPFHPFDASAGVKAVLFYEPQQDGKSNRAGIRYDSIDDTDVHLSISIRVDDGPETAVGTLEEPRHGYSGCLDTQLPLVSSCTVRKLQCRIHVASNPDNSAFDASPLPSAGLGTAHFHAQFPNDVRL